MGAEDLSQDIQEGPFKSFPHYATIGREISYDRANVLADRKGWSILTELYFNRVYSFICWSIKEVGSHLSIQIDKAHKNS